MNQPQYAPRPMPQEYPQGTQILVLGILSLVCCSPLGIFAWVQGNNALKVIDQNPFAYSNRGTVQVGRILGIVGTVLMVISIVSAILYVVGFAIVISQSPDALG